MRVKKLLLLVAITTLFLPLPTAGLPGTCTAYSNVGVQYHDGYGMYCGGTNSGCTECVDIESNFWQICVYMTLDDIYCTSGGIEYGGL